MKVYADEGISGTNTKKRLAFQAILQKSYISDLLTKKLKRIKERYHNTIRYYHLTNISIKCIIT